MLFLFNLSFTPFSAHGGWRETPPTGVIKRSVTFSTLKTEKGDINMATKRTPVKKSAPKSVKKSKEEILVPPLRKLTKEEKRKYLTGGK